MQRRYFISTFSARCIASCLIVFTPSFIITLLFNGGSLLGDTFTVPWFPFAWKFGPTGIWQPLPLALMTLAILVIAARWRWASLIATLWFLLNVLFTLLFMSVYDGKA